MPYPNVTNITGANIGSVTDLITVANDLTGSLLGIGLSLVIWALMFSTIYGRTYKTKSALAASSFIAFVINSLLVGIGMLSVFWASLPLIALAASLFIQD